MCAPAIWNGYPLIYFDSEDYVEISFTFEPIIWRIMTYGAFLSVARVFDTLWAAVAVQGLLVAWLLHEAVCGFVPRWRLLVYVPVAFAVALFTGLPWVSSQIMADVFAGLSILGLAVLAFGENLPRWRRWALVPVVALSISVHMTHVAVTSGLLIVLAAMALVPNVVRRMPRPGLLIPAVAVLLGTLWVPTLHWAATGRFFFSESGQVLQLALFVQDGLAKKYLDEVCPKGAQLKMCGHKEELPYTADEFLWGETPFDDMGGWKAMHDEASVIVKGTIKMFPLEVAEAALENTLTQWDQIGVGEDLLPMSWHFVKTQLKRYPHEFKQFRFAQQQRHPAIDFETINAFQTPIAQAAQIATAVLLFLAWRRRDRVTTGLAVVVLMGFLGNAIVCGAVSNPHERYQNRVVWLSLFTVVVGAVRLDQRFAGKRRPIQSTRPDGSAASNQTAA